LTGFELLDEASLDATNHRQICDLLVAAYLQFTEDFRDKSYWGSKPDFRIWLRGQNQNLIAHLEFGYRKILVDQNEILIAGVGAVCTHPNIQRTGLGIALVSELKKYLFLHSRVDFAFLGCREAVAGFYQRAGFFRTDQTVRYLDPDTAEWEQQMGIVMVLPIHKPIEGWPGGLVDLRGMPW
jgi:nodulation protein A